MEIPLVDPASMPVPPEEVRIQSLAVTPYPDGRRLQIDLKLSPFHVSPEIDIVARDNDGKELASTSILGSENPDMVLTMHLRAENIPPEIVLQAAIQYPDIGTVDQKVVEKSLPPESAREGE
jgi:hypothetical protein